MADFAIIAVGFVLLAVLLEQQDGAQGGGALGWLDNALGSATNTLETQAVSVTHTSGDVDTLARTIRGEAANQPYAAMQGVANVVMNRVKDFSGFAKTAGDITATCKAPDQFDCWNPSLGSQADYELTTKPWTSSASDQQCLAIAKAAAAGTLPDNTGGATYYHNTTDPEEAPHAWGSVTRTAQIGAFTFYKEA
jgi:spore germination cell wall hydrolase CwlJ-like protein